MDPAAHRLGTALCVASAIAFGAMAIFGKLAYDAGVSLLTLLFIRFSIAAPVLWIVSLRRPGALTGASRRTLSAGFALGAIGYATQASLYFAALTRMDASLLSMVLYTFPAIVVAAAIALGRESASRRRTGALLVSSGGLALVLLGAGAGTFDWLGASLGLCAALVYAAYILVSDRVVGGELAALPLSALITTGAAITFGIAGTATGTIDTGFASEGWLWLGAIAIVSTVTPIALFFAGLERVGPSTAAILSTLEPLTTVALAFVVFGESLTALQLAGAALVLGAAVSLNLRPRGRGRAEPLPV